MSTVYTVLQKRGLKANKGGGHCFRCVHPDCKYAAGDGEAYRCDYIGQTGHSRLL